jgi:predicted  nucleic acid-binding Zn-ribbon protein
LTPEETQALLDLQQLDLKLIEYEKHQKIRERLVAEIEAPVNIARDEKQRVEAEMAEAQMQHRHFELELVSNNEQFKKLQTQQMNVRNQIEYNAFIHEMDALKERADALEESGIRWIEKAEAAKVRLPELTSKLGEEEKSAARKMEELQAKTTELKRIHDEASALRAPLLKKIPSTVLSYYERLRRTGKIPFATVVRRGACGGCGFRHPPQRLQEIKMGRRMIACEQCWRIQIWREEEEEKIGF